MACGHLPRCSIETSREAGSDPPLWSTPLAGDGFPAPPRSVGEDVLLAPAGEVELGARREAAEDGFRQRGAPLTRQHLVEPRLERVQVEHVGGGVFELRRAELGAAPVGGLLLLAELDAEQVADQV